MARKFLYLIAAIILVIFGFGVAYQLNPGWFGRVAFVPSTQFVEQAAAAPNAYDDPAMWFARPGLADDPADWRPPVEGQKEAIAAKADGSLTLHLRCGLQVESLAADALCIYIGNRPNSDLVAGQVDLTPEGYIITDRDGRSSAPGLYAVGDVCTQPAYQSLSVAAGQAVVVAKHALLHR